MAKDLAAQRAFVRSWLGMSSARVTDGVIDEAVNDVLEELCAFDLSANFVVDGDTSTSNPTFAPSALSTVAGTYRYALPTGFLRPYMARIPDATNSNLWNPLIFVGARDEWLDRFPDPGATASRGRPSHWAIFDNAMWLGPTPDAVYSVRREYFRNLTVSASTDTNEILTNHEKLVKWGTLSNICAFGFEDERAPMFLDKYERAKREFLSTQKSKRSQGRRPISRAFGSMPKRETDGE